jgi:hypothetical protein
MKRLIVFGPLAACACVVGLGVPGAHAGPMQTTTIVSPPPGPPPAGGFSASYGTINPAYFPTGNPQTVKQKFTLGKGTALFGGNAPVGALNVSDLFVDASPFPGNLPPSATGPVTLTNPFTVTDPANGKTATFNFTNPATVKESGSPPNSAVTGTISAPIKLVSNNDPNLNLSGFATGGMFVANFSNIDFENIPPDGGLVPAASPFQAGNGFAIYPAVPNGAISFTLTITPNQAPTVVPEPGSLALWGLAAVAGLNWLRRRRARAAA